MAIPTEPTLSTRMRSLKRGAGQSATKFAAYMSGTKIECEQHAEKLAAIALAKEDGTKPKLPEPKEYDYRHRIGVEFSELVTPEGAPEWAKDRQTLWNRAEAAERRKDSQVAREFRFGFSYDLTAEQRQGIARQVAARFAGMQMCVDVAVHRYSQAWAASDPRTAEQLGKWQSWGIPFVDAERSMALNSEHVMVRTNPDGSVKDFRWFQPHCHLLMALRPLADDGLGFAGKTEEKRKVLGEDGQPVLDSKGKPTWEVVSKSLARQWNEQFQDGACEELRGWITTLQNELLAANGSPRRIDARGYEVRRAEALDLAANARAAGQEVEAARQEARAAMLHREPEPRLGVALRVKEFADHVRKRFSAWVAVRHRNRLQPQITALWERDPVDFVTKAHHLLELARQGLGLLLPPKPIDSDREVSLER